MEQRKRTAVVASGNSLMTDEGVGIHVLQRLAARDLPPDVDLVEAGSSAMSVVHAIAGRRKAVLVDCAYMDEPPGTIRRFPAEDVVSRKARGGLSLHEGDLLVALELSRCLGESPEEVIIFGIQPESVGPGESLTATLSARLDTYTAAVAAELDK